MSTIRMLTVLLLAIALLPVLAVAQLGFILTTPETEATVEAGQFYSFENTLENTGHASDVFTISLVNEDVPQDWSTSMCVAGMCYPSFVREVTDTIPAYQTHSISVDFLTTMEPGTGSVWLRVQSENYPEAVDSVQFIMHTQEEPPISVTLFPLNPPIVVPAGGGIFQFNAELTNNTPDAIQFDAWTYVTLPSGNIYGPLLLATDINLPGGATITPGPLTQQVPGGAPAGLYVYVAAVGTHPNFVLDSDFFEFTKNGFAGFTDGVSEWGISGWDEQYHVKETSGLIPDGFRMDDVYPNPFNPTAIIPIALPEAAELNLSVYSLTGRLVTVITDGAYSPGYYNFNFNGRNLASGVYLFKATINGQVNVVRKAVLAR